MTRKAEAQQVLFDNWRNGYSIPSPLLYPFQWLWDSGFIALGYSHFDEDKAWSEIDHVFKGQWNNGLLPHIIFHEESDQYYPGPEVWQTHTFAQAPSTPKTSGITQPPVLGFVLEQLYHSSADKELAKEKVDVLIPKIKAFHQFLYNERDPNGEHLVYIRHNWESGLDNSPLWDAALKRIDAPQKDLASIRRDLAHVKADNRPSNDEYLKYIWLVEHFVECGYEEREIQKACPFLIQDPVFNALLIASNEALYRLSSDIDQPDSDFQRWAKAGKQAMNSKLWDESTANYVGFDLVVDARINAPSNAGFIAALFAEIPEPDQVEKILNTHFSNFPEHDFLMMPTVMPDHSLFEGKRYWRGPIWINTNWLLVRGLQKHGHTDWAHKVREHTLELIEEFGFYEYFHPSKKTPEPCGTPMFSWSAALYLDLIHRP